MDGLENIFTRRSIRKYKPEKIKDSEITKLLEAAMSAPSAGNQQIWHFIVVEDKKKLVEVTNFHPHSQMLKGASHAIVVCADLENEVYPGYWIQDCAAAVQNILLAANAQGIGSCWLGITPRQDRIDGAKVLFNLPENVQPLAIISLGYPDEEKGPSERYDKTRIHRNEW